MANIDLTERVRKEFVARQEFDSARRLTIAQAHYKEWLESEGINDPEARVSFHPYLGFVGNVGEGSTRPHGRIYDILPTGVLIKINREIGKLLAADPEYIRQFAEPKKN